MAKLRVYELAKELGITNKECIDLCNELGYGVKSHSSSLAEAYADQVRRKAAREGLLKPAGSEETSEPQASTKDEAADSGNKSVSTKPAAAQSAAAEPKEQAAPATDSASETTQPAPAAKAAEGTDQTETASSQASTGDSAAVEAAPASSDVDSSSDDSAAATHSVDEAPAAPAPQAPVKKVVSSKPTAPKPQQARPAEAQRPARPAGAPGAAPAARQRPADSGQPAAKPAAAAPADSAPTGDAGPAAGAAPGARPGPPLSSTGKPIPPPPGPPLSRTGKPIPPPPGRGGRGPAPAPSRGPGGPARGGPARGPRPAGGGFSRPGGGGFAPPPGGGPGGGPGGPGGGPGGRPGGGRPGGPQQRPRRKGRRRRNREELQPMDMPSYTPASAPVPEGQVVIERGSTPQDLGPKLNRTAADVVRFLLQQGEMVTATQSLSDEMIELFATEVGADITLVDLGEEQEVELRKVLETPDDDEPAEDWVTRPPVITVMGHVDHGKTKLLDRIRNANVAGGESGGITQHIGAYQVHHSDRLLTFIDTPGHEAFTAMRSRGAEATDIVILVVAADDGVMPQTVEAIQHAKAAEVPIVVAINKIDREGADPTRVMQQLSEHDLIPEAWGGDTVMVEVSALTGDGIDDLLDTLLLVADVEDLRASPDGRARGVVLEAHLDIGRGAVASVLVQHGVLRVGEPMVAGPAWGRIRALINDRGEQLKEAPPSTPVEVLGLSDVAFAGDDFIVAPDERKARSVAEARERWHREAERGRDASVNVQGAKLEDIFAQIQAGEQATLNLIIKADARGSLEALTDSLKELERPEVKIGFVLRGVGAVSESDIALAATSDATIVGYNVRPSRQARDLAASEGVEIRTYEIIYKLLEDIESAMVGMLAPEFEEVVTGEAEVREIFRVPKIGAVAGCLVQSGVVTRGTKVRFIRDGTVIWNGEISSLRRFKDDVKEVAAGYECGIGLSDFQDLKSGDIIETYELREIPRS
ncbi:MAG: translation initiation factor IF-2 [Microthrixaceae bacterium]|nr:translation initiation factor IF-2 [Microthrixaceae bacterium]